MPQISIVVAMNQDNIIGVDNQLPWHIPEDLAHFKQITLGKPIIMGRKTFESIGRILPGRKNIIISRNHQLKIDGTDIYTSIEAAISENKEASEICIIGGGEIFNQALYLCDRLYITIVEYEIATATSQSNIVYFPKLDLKIWQLSETQKLTSSNGVKCNFNTYLRDRT